LSASCGTTKPARFYTLQSLTNEAAGKRGFNTEGARDAANGVAIGLGPLTLPTLLERPQIVTRMGDNELTFAEFDRWAEPLDENIYRVLTENMSILLNTGYVYDYPWKSAARIDYQVAIDVIRFDVTADGETFLVARWTIYDGDGRNVLMKKKSHFEKSVATKEYPSFVSALNRDLNDFSREIAGAIKSLYR